MIIRFSTLFFPSPSAAKCVRDWLSEVVFSRSNFSSEFHIHIVFSLFGVNLIKSLNKAAQVKHNGKAQNMKFARQKHQISKSYEIGIVGRLLALSLSPYLIRSLID
jgi:hypothetical protein